MYDNAGTAVLLVMLVTTFLMIPIMLLVWRSHWILIIIFASLSLLVEVTYFSSVLLKIGQGGWLPLVISSILLIVMFAWHYGTLKRYEHEMHSKVSMAWIVSLGPSLGLVRVPGIGLVYTELTKGVPHIFSHLVTNLPAIHSVVVFVCVKYLPVYIVPMEERFLIKRIGPKSFRMFRCIVRYGYKDIHNKGDNFENMLFDRLMGLVQLELMMEGSISSLESYDSNSQHSEELIEHSNGNLELDFVMMNKRKMKLTMSVDDGLSSDMIVSAESTTEMEGSELEFMKRNWAAGVVHILGNTIIKTKRDSSIFKKVTVNYIYGFLRKICREHSVIFHVPHESLLNVGQMFYV